MTKIIELELPKKFNYQHSKMFRNLSQPFYWGNATTRTMLYAQMPAR